MTEISVAEKRDPKNPINSRTFEERDRELQVCDEKLKKAQKLAKNSPFNRWAQLNLEHAPEMIWLSVRYPKAHGILYFLVNEMDEYNAIMCSMEVMQSALHISRQTISKQIKILQEHGFISVLKSGKSNVYTVNSQIYWKSWGDKHKYSKFPANVVLSLDEQDESIKQMEKNIKANRYKAIEKVEKKKE